MLWMMFKSSKLNMQPIGWHSWNALGWSQTIGSPEQWFIQLLEKSIKSGWGERNGKSCDTFYVGTARQKSQPLPQLGRISGEAQWKRKYLMKFHTQKFHWGILHLCDEIALRELKYSYIHWSGCPFTSSSILLCLILLKPLLVSLSVPDRRWFTTVWQWLLYLSDWRVYPGCE